MNFHTFSDEKFIFEKFVNLSNFLES